MSITNLNMNLGVTVPKRSAHTYIVSLLTFIFCNKRVLLT